MTAVFDGTKVARDKLEVLAAKISDLKKKNIIPRMASVFLTTDSGSVLYTKLKKEKAESIGIHFESHPIELKEAELFKQKVKLLTSTTGIHGILVQKPSGGNNFTKDEWSFITSVIPSDKDIDCLNANNLGLLMMGTPKYLPATVKAVLTVLAVGKISLPGKRVVVLGASEILGKPLAILLTEQNATVSLLHKATYDIANFVKEADIVISATGQTGLIRGDMVKNNAVVIDVGAPKGDVETLEMMDKASFISPVPGGVGPLTIACLLENLVDHVAEIANQ